MVQACGYNCALAYLILVVVGVGAFFPQLVLVAARNARHASVDYHWSRVPVHPIGWVTILGVWGHIPALWMASKLSGDLYSVSFSFLGPPLIVVSLILSRRWVEGSSPPRPERSEVDGDGPPADEF